MNADGYIGANGDILGYNMFAYCGNNPAIRIDPNGNFWWIIPIIIPLIITGCSNEPDPEPLRYSTADDAAKAFAEACYGISLYIRFEFSTLIYSRTIDGVTTYDYTSPKVGNPHNCSPITSIPEGTTRVAYAHTHPNSNSFSKADKDFAKTHTINAYVVGPDYNLQRYDYSSSTTTSFCTISITKVPKGIGFLLKLFYKSAWEKHLKEGCDFNCKDKKWPSY